MSRVSPRVVEMCLVELNLIIIQYQPSPFVVRVICICQQASVICPNTISLIDSEFQEPVPGLRDVVLEVISPSVPMSLAPHQASTQLCRMGPLYLSQGNICLVQCVGNDMFTWEKGRC